MKTFSITDAGAIREMNQDFYFSPGMNRYPSSKRLSTRQMSFWWLSLVGMKLSVEWVPP